MKTIALTLFAAAALFAQSSPSTAPAAAAKEKRPKKKATSAAADKNKKTAPVAKAAPEPPPPPHPPLQSIPTGATMIEPNLYRYTDSSGKTWNYKKTPFGISRWEETAAPAAAVTSSGEQAETAQPGLSKSDPIVVTDLGDSYRFERKTPFGGSSWVRKKSELTDEERSLTSEQSSPQPNPAVKPAGN